MSKGARLRSLAPGPHSTEETSQRWRAVGDTALNLNDPGIELITSCAHSDDFNHYNYFLTALSFRTCGTVRAMMESEFVFVMVKLVIIS